jgi:hypothetical protein
MPAIRLADIPNAGPQALGPSSVLQPQVAQLGSAAAVNPNAMDRVARSMFTQTLELDAFSQEARAAAQLGAAISGIGDVALEWSQKFAKAKDDADITRAETVLESARQKQLIEQETLPVEKWQDNWTRNQEQAKRALAEIKMSRRAAEQLMPAYERWTVLSSLDIEARAQKRQLDIFKMDAEIGYKREVANDNLDGAFGIISRFEKNGTISPEEAKRMRFDVEIETIKKSKAERNANIASAIILDPQKWERDLMEGLETGKSKLQTDLTTEEMVRFLANARQQSRIAEVDKMSLLENMLLEGQFQSRKDLEKALDDKNRPDLMPNIVLPERARQSLLSSWDTLPEQQADAIKLIPALIAKIDAYEPFDDQSLEGYIALASEARMLPEGYRREPLDLLYDKFRAFKDSRKPVPATALSQVKKLASKDLDSGGYGKWKTDKNGQVTDKTRQAYIEANLRYSQEITALENWAKANPEKAKVDAEVYRAYNDIITQQNKLDAAAGRPSNRKPVDFENSKKPKPPSFWSGESYIESISSGQYGTKPPVKIPDPDEVLRSSPTGASAPATIRHNNPGAIYPSGLASKYGATGSSTIGGGHKIATFNTPEDGAAAQFAQLNRPQYLNKPLREAIRTWSGNNSVDTYLQVIQREAGLSPDTVLTADLLADPAVAIPLAKAMARHETGKPFPLAETGWQKAHARVFST